MNEYLVKIRFGLTIDVNRQRPEPCPYCGRVVCHVKENDEDVFCLNSLCNFHSTIDNSHYNWLKERFLEDARSGHVWFNVNNKYSWCSHPFIHENDIKNNKYIIRDFRLDEEKYYSIYANLGLPKTGCARPDSPIIAHYLSLDLMFQDGWINNYDMKIK